MREFEKIFQSQYFSGLVICFIAAIFVAPPEALLQNDLDSAVRWASSELFDFGSPNFYLYPHTNGPLFFLKFPTPGNLTILLAGLFDFITKVILGYYLIVLSNFLRPKNVWLPLAILVLFCSLFYLDFIIIGIALAICLIALRSQKIVSLLPGLAIIIISIFIKASISFPTLFILGSTILVLLYQKKFSFTLQLIAASLLGFLLLTVLLYGNLSTSLSWLFTAFISTLSYGADQAIAFNNNLALMLLTAAAILIIPILIRNKPTRIFMFITALAIFSIWKYSLGREDFTHYRAWYYLCILLACFVVLINHKKNAIIGFACFFLSLSFFVTNTSLGDSPKTMSFNMPRLDILPRLLVRNKKVNEEFHARSLNAMSSHIISDSMLQIISDETVDVFPWGLAIVYKYNLNYKARPSFHSTILGTKNDKKESVYWASDQAPQFVLWHESQPSLYSLNAHDQVYLPNAVPYSFVALMQHYSLQRFENGYALWRKNNSAHLKENLPAESKINDTSFTIHMNEWFALPPTDSNVMVYAKTNLKLSSLEKFVSFIYKGPFFKMAYKLKNGKEAWHFVSLTSLQNNFLVQPYFTNPALEKEMVSEIFIEPMDLDYRGKAMKINLKPKIYKTE